MKKIEFYFFFRIFSVFGGKIFCIFEQACNVMSENKYTRIVFMSQTLRWLIVDRVQRFCYRPGIFCFFIAG